LVGSCERGDEPSSSEATELVSHLDQCGQLVILHSEKLRELCRLPSAVWIVKPEKAMGRTSISDGGVCKCVQNFSA
jgi:hypothetical protein